MKYCILLTLCLLELALESVGHAAPACKDLATARSLYESGDTALAKEALVCLIRQNPKDVESIRYLSDIRWWEGHPLLSVGLAQMGQDRLGNSADFELRQHLYQRVSRYRLSLDSSLMHSDFSTTGLDLGVAAQARYWNKNVLGLSYSRLNRVFAGTTKITNEVYELSHVNPLGSMMYLESGVGYSPIPVFVARWFALATPHYVFRDDSDLSLGYRYNSYSNSQASVLQAAWTKPYFSVFTLGLQAQAILSDGLLCSGGPSLEWRASPRIVVRGNFNLGRTLEEPGIQGTFFSPTLILAYSPIVPLILRLSGSLYNGNLRTENRIGLGAEVAF